jgi:hypothetical protein
MKAIVAESATAITKGTDDTPKRSAVSIAIGIKIAAVALFEMKFVNSSEIRLKATIINIRGAEPRIDAMTPLISLAAPDTIIASLKRIPPPTRNTNSH